MPELIDLTIIPEHLVFSVMKKMWLKEYLKIRRTCKGMNSFLEELEGNLNVTSRFDLMIQVEEVTLQGEVLVGAYLCEMPSFCRAVHIFNSPEEIPSFVRYKSIRVMDSCNPVREVPMSVYNLPKLFRSMKLKCHKLRTDLRSHNEAVFHLLKAVKFGSLHLSMASEIGQLTRSPSIFENCSKLVVNCLDKWPQSYAELGNFSSVKLLYAPPRANLNQMFANFLENIFISSFCLNHLRVPAMPFADGTPVALNHPFITKFYEGKIYQAYHFKRREDDSCLWAYESPCILYQFVTPDGEKALLVSGKDNFTGRGEFFFSFYKSNSEEEFLFTLGRFLFGSCFLFDFSGFIDDFRKIPIENYQESIQKCLDYCRGYLERVI